MRIGIDVRHLARGPYAGVAAVTRRLVESLADAAPRDAFCIFYRGRQEPPAFVLAWPKRFSNLTLSVSRGSNRLFDLAARLGVAPELDRIAYPPRQPALDRGDVEESGPRLFQSRSKRVLRSESMSIDVWFSPHTVLAPLAVAPRVLVLHDLSFAAYPPFFSLSSRLWHALMGIRQQAERADAIIVPSYATRRDLLRLWRIPEKKIHVIPWGTLQEDSKSKSQNPKQPLDAEFQIPNSRCVLFLGTVEHRKNVIGLVRAFEILKEGLGFADVRLVIAGAMGRGSRDVAGAVKASKAARDIEVRGYVSEDEKAVLLAQAAVFVYPSLYEGFGLPVLEAMAAGVPVVCGSGTSLPEITGSAALLVDPRRPDEIAHAIREVLVDSRIVHELSRCGRERAQHFTWEKTAKRVLAVLRESARKQQIVNGKE